ncbi:hypothetical protein PHLCEN_2v12760 [Hermanssonia centrifuga]|uniref:Uncharacterized protein n=1 Tax=Hermanssonia centrifuga TaxID=98765 RepID=A0A2R6NG78_9APHY|nr:hypothetical protein PHLCEN_2v12760 [Hermanssonia centrifuga]
MQDAGEEENDVATRNTHLPRGRGDETPEMKQLPLDHLRAPGIQSLAQKKSRKQLTRTTSMK